MQVRFKRTIEIGRKIERRNIDVAHLSAFDFSAIGKAQSESKVSTELAMQRFGRSLTLPGAETRLSESVIPGAIRWSR